MNDKVNIELSMSDLVALQDLLRVAVNPQAFTFKFEDSNRKMRDLEWKIRNALIPVVEGWVPRFMPFILGGDVHRPAKCELQVANIFPVGKEYFVCGVFAPNGKMFYFEKECGALLGSDLEMIRNDVAEGAEEVMNKQIEEGKKIREKAEKLNSALFWSYVKGSGAKREVI